MGRNSNRCYCGPGKSVVHCAADFCCAETPSNAVENVMNCGNYYVKM